MNILERSKIQYTTLNEIIKSSKAESIKSNTTRRKSLLDHLEMKIKYGYDALDYQVYGFSYIKDLDKRLTYLSTRDWSLLNRMFNKPTCDEDNIDLKTTNALIFPDFYNRDFLILRNSTEDEIKSFIKKHKHFYAKRDVSHAGIGVFKIKTEKFRDIDQILKHIGELKIELLEEEIIQDPILEKISPSCACTIRVNTVLDKDGNVHLLPTICRMGEGNVEYIISGQFYSPIDNEGVILEPAFKQDGDFNNTGGEYFSNHPYTNEKLVGFKVPFIKETLEMAIEGAKRVPHFPYIGWDIGITSKGPAMMEVNPNAANDIIQPYKHRARYNFEGVSKDVFKWLDMDKKTLYSKYNINLKYAK